MALEVGMNIEQLLGESNIDSWDNALRNTLDVYGLLNYLDEDVQPPTPKDPDAPTAAEKKAAEGWRVERARVLLAITNSMKSRNVQILLQNSGWNPADRDPKRLYDLIKRVVPKVSQESIGMVIKEYTSLNRASFDSMASFLNRHFFLRKRWNDLKLTVSPQVEIWFLLNGLESSYPLHHRLWVNDLTNGHLTMSDLLDKLNTIATTEATTPALSVQVKAGTKEKEDTKSSNNKKDKKKGRREMIDCTHPGCKRQIPTGFVHAACGHHRNPDNDVCWWCEPDKAPATWQNKEKAIKALQKTSTGTTALVVHNSSNLNNPATTGSNLLFANSIPEFSMLGAILNPAGFH
ncbi:hypothetical protein B0H65DRAFT_564711 [Neurospora tetraspora]|uniref:Uncharacterized protein n=1 Tax=Neurospora tetraspora TaxID=94610 RepID=A0AAE0JRQ9_9PEZI|nr:hypothetical protein B0H65DRAFT_564415 [Neurospora tetraspora]KAK3355779.1 hypothetical protein B0H65DRAFT_564711 [Neurospora tetraspora]